MVLCPLQFGWSFDILSDVWFPIGCIIIKKEWQSPVHDLWQEDPDCRYNYFSALTPILQWNIKQGYKFTLFPEVFSVNDLYRYIKYFLTARSWLTLFVNTKILTIEGLFLGTRIKVILDITNPIPGGDENLHHPLYFLQYCQGANMHALKTYYF